MFGNAGGLFMAAMTWWDHKTQSIWSQPWGRAISGELKGVQLHLLPSRITTWGNWKREYPETLAMVNDVELIGRRQAFSKDFVIGLLADGQAKAYYYRDVEQIGVVNDFMGELPVMVWAGGNDYQAYLRQVGARQLTFVYDEGVLRDRETSTIWNLANGLGLEGPLQGEVLQPVPATSSYDWAWQDFYPQSEFFEP